MTAASNKAASVVLVFICFVPVVVERPASREHRQPTDGPGCVGILRRQIWQVQDVLALSDMRTKTTQHLPLEGRSGRQMSQKATGRKCVQYTHENPRPLLPTSTPRPRRRHNNREERKKLTV